MLCIASLLIRYYGIILHTPTSLVMANFINMIIDLNSLFYTVLLLRFNELFTI